MQEVEKHKQEPGICWATCFRTSPPQREVWKVLLSFNRSDAAKCRHCIRVIKHREEDGLKRFLWCVKRTQHSYFIKIKWTWNEQLQSSVTFQIKMSHESRVSDAAAAVILPPLPFLSCCPVTVRVKDTGSKQVKSAFKMQPLTIYLLKVITHMFQTRPVQTW